jgi:hypothetical protein
LDVVASQADLTKEPKFAEAVAHKVYYGPVYFRRESEPYMTLARTGTRRDAGVSVAEVNLKLIWDVVSQIKVGNRGQAVVDAQARLIAHPDISLVLRNTDLSRKVRVLCPWREAVYRLPSILNSLCQLALPVALLQQPAVQSLLSRRKILLRSGGNAA